jgi:hypothetical protein
LKSQPPSSRLGRLPLTIHAEYTNTVDVTRFELVPPANWPTFNRYSYIITSLEEVNIFGSPLYNIPLNLLCYPYTLHPMVDDDGVEPPEPVKALRLQRKPLPLRYNHPIWYEQQDSNL